MTIIGTMPTICPFIMSCIIDGSVTMRMMMTQRARSIQARTAHGVRGGDGSLLGHEDAGLLVVEVVLASQEGLSMVVMYDH